MQRLIKTYFYLFLLCLFFILGCKPTSKSTHKKYLEHLQSMNDDINYEYLEELRKKNISFNMDSIKANTSNFYDIEVSSKPNKKVFNLAEQKLVSMQITNYGTKELYLPEWFRINNDFDNTELKIEIYKKRKQKFEKYVQKSMTTFVCSHPAINAPKRVVLETNKGKHILYENIWVDFNKIIVDEGSYKAKIYIDLSAFGYFKILETEMFFEVKNEN